MRILVVGLFVFGIGACASVEKDNTTSSGAATAATPAADNKICKQMRVMGSNYPRRQCLTAAEWAQYDKEGQEQVETFERDIQNTGTNLPLGQ
jgi:hypothetical protein